MYSKSNVKNLRRERFAKDKVHHQKFRSEGEVLCAQMLPKLQSQNQTVRDDFCELKMLLELQTLDQIVREDFCELEMLLGLQTLNQTVREGVELNVARTVVSKSNSS